MPTETRVRQLDVRIRRLLDTIEQLTALETPDRLLNIINELKQVGDLKTLGVVETIINMFRDHEEAISNIDLLMSDIEMDSSLRVENTQSLYADPGSGLVGRREGSGKQLGHGDVEQSSQFKKPQVAGAVENATPLFSTDTNLLYVTSIFVRIHILLWFLFGIRMLDILVLHIVSTAYQLVFVFSANGFFVLSGK